MIKTSLPAFFLIAACQLCAASAHASPTDSEQTSEPTDMPANFVTICTLEENCAVEDSTLVAFGSAGKYVYKTLSGEFLCSPIAFGLERTESDSSASCSVIDPDSSLSSQSSSHTPSSQSSAAQAIQGTYALVSRSSGKALTIVDGSLDDGAFAAQEDFNQQNQQLWQIQPLSNGYYSITALHSEKSLEIVDWNNRDGGALQQLPWINSWSQHWEIESIPGGFVKITSRTNGQALDVYEMNNKEQGDVVLWTYWGGENQQWQLVPIDK